MRYLTAGLAGLFLAAAPVHADACLDEVRAMHAADLDPFARPAYRMENTVYAADGSVVRVFDSWIETPLIAMSGVRGAGLYALIRDRESWTGPTPEGPWTKAPALLPEDRRATAERMHDEETANLQDVACLGSVERDGQSWLAYRYTTRTDPDPTMGDNWFGATTTVYLDPETRLPGLFEQEAMVSKWAPEPSTERFVIVFDYDPDMALPNPE